MPGKDAGSNKVTRPGSRGTTISVSSSPPKGELTQFHDSIPAAARLPPDDDDVMWVNNKGEVKQRQVIGSRVLIRQQPAAPPSVPEILVLTDQMLKRFQRPDRYMKCICMSGYALKDFTNNIKDSMFDVSYPYIMIFLGSMQLGLYELKKLQKDVGEFAAIVTEVTPNTMMILSGLVPRPMDFEKSAPRCRTYSRSYQDITRQLCNTNGYNITAVSVFEEFLDENKRVKDVEANFEEGIYLTVAGIRLLRAAWLRFLGYFPKKAGKKSSASSAAGKMVK